MRPLNIEGKKYAADEKVERLTLNYWCVIIALVAVFAVNVHIKLDLHTTALTSYGGLYSTCASRNCACQQLVGPN